MRSNVDMMCSIRIIHIQEATRQHMYVTIKVNPLLGYVQVFVMHVALHASNLMQGLHYGRVIR